MLAKRINYLVTNLDRIVNTPMDFPHFIGLLCHNKNGIVIAKIETECGEIFDVSIQGDSSAKNVQGEIVKSCYDLQKYIKSGREKEVVYNDVCYFEVSGKLGDKPHYGSFQSLGQILESYSLG